MGVIYTTEVADLSKVKLDVKLFTINEETKQKAAAIIPTVNIGNIQKLGIIPSKQYATLWINNLPECQLKTDIKAIFEHLPEISKRPKKVKANQSHNDNDTFYLVKRN